jgi:hypothetical protein
MPDITLLDVKGNVHRTGGLNWGTNLQNHTTPIDAYIPIHIGTVRQNPGLFDIKGPVQTVITLHWDDGVTMQVLFEGNSIGQYPKQISSTPNKNTLGACLRGRFGIPNNQIFTMNDLNQYGRTTVTIDRINATNYNMSL